MPALDHRRVEARADSPHRLGHPETGAHLGEQRDGKFRSLVRVKDDAPDVAAAPCRCHLARASGEFGSVVFAEREAGDAACRQVQDAGEVEPPHVGRDLGQVTAPLLVWPRNREVSFDGVGDGICRLVRTRAGAKASFRTHHEERTSHRVGHRLTDTFHPGSRSSAWRRGDP